jgi:hypothetical protein
MKKCTKCGIEREGSLLCFYKDKSKIDGLHSTCKSCDNDLTSLKRKNPKYIFEFNKYQKIWLKKYRQTPKHKEWRRKALIVQSQKAKEAKRSIVDHYGGKCVCCGITDICFLSVDHINNDGFKDRDRKDGTKRKNRVSGYIFYKKIIKDNFPNNLQILCFNCNTAKQHNKGICPHQTLKK